MECLGKFQNVEMVHVVRGLKIVCYDGLVRESFHSKEPVKNRVSLRSYVSKDAEGSRNADRKSVV